MADDSFDPVYDRAPREAELWRGGRSTLARLLQALPLRRMAIASTIAVFLLLLGFLVYYLLHRTDRTPIIAVRTACYEWPFPPQAWVAEDLAKISDLDDASIDHHLAIDVRGVTLVDAATGPMLAGLDKNAMSLERGTAIIIYISMHGVGRDGEPYLVSPGASPANESTWWKLSVLLTNINAELAKIPGANDKLKLVVLDCSRVPVNWYLGWLHNDFSSALQQWWKAGGATSFPNYAILSAAGPGERSWTSSELNNSVFAHFFYLGLAGAADEGQSHFFQSKSVSLGELQKYLQDNVGGWVSANRADKQEPLLLTANAAQSDVVLASSLFEPGPPSQARASDRNHEERVALWQSLEQLRELGLYRFDPLCWRSLEHELLWLNQLADAGTAYESLEQSTLDDLQVQMDSIHERLSRGHGDRSLTGRISLISGERDDATRTLKLRSLPLAEFFGTLTPSALTATRGQLEQFQATPDQQQLQRAERALERAGLNDLVEAQFLQMLDKYQFPELWQNSERLRRLLALRPPAQDYGVPQDADGFVGDERVHGWVRPLAESADDARRAAEDQLFVDRQPGFDDRLAAAQLAAESTGRAMATAQKAMRVRDMVWAELPYLAEWHASPLRRLDRTPAANDVEERLIQLASSTKTLEAQLAQRPVVRQQVDIENDLPAIGALSEQIAQEFSALKLERFIAECEGLRNETNKGWRIRKIEAALANPLLPAKLRGELEAIASQYQGGSQIQSEAQVQSIYAVAGDESTRLPLALLLFADEGGAGDLSDRWQRGIRSLQVEVAAANENDRSRQDWSKLDDRVRSVASIIYRDANGISDRELGRPVRQLRAIDLRELVLWHAVRVRRDFWGPAGDSTPFVLLAANDYLDAARILGKKPAARAQASTDPAEVAALREQVRQEVAATGNWLTTKATDAMLLETGDEAITRISVSGGSSSAPTVDGTAAIFVERNDRRVSGVSYSPAGSIALPVRSQTIEASIAGQQPSPTTAAIEQKLDATTMFRGFEFPGRFLVEPLRGVVIDDVPHAYGPGRVTLRSPWRSLSVQLVLDCSQSMDQPLENGQSRLAVAKEALEELLTALSAKHDVRVGVRLFGHRLGWSTDRPVRVLASPTYAGAIPPDLTPDRDVERVLPLGEFDFNSAQVVFSALEGVEHGWGQSPLYFALDQALAEDFANADAASDKHLIVITDGRNYQARPTSAERTSLSNVAQSARSLGVPIHILALAPDASDDPREASLFLELANQTGGSSESISGVPHLQKTLQSLVRPDDYQLDDAAGQIVDQGELGVPLADGTGRRAGLYTVRYENAFEKILFAGGEAIELYARQGDSQLYAYPFDNDVAGDAWFELATDGGDEFIERVHRPLGSARNVEFRVSLQRSLARGQDGNSDAWQWTPRPQEAWVEIAPMSTDGKLAGQTYLFYDSNYLPDQPVPVLELVARDWPVGVTRAAISSWYKSSATEPTLRLPLEAGERELPNGVRLRVNADYTDDSRKLYRVRVVERHNGPAAANDWLKIVPPTTVSRRPSRIVRQLDERHGAAVHTFFYSQLDQRDVEQLHAGGIGVLSRQAALAGAIQAGPIEVQVSTAGELLPLAGNNGSDAAAARSDSYPAR